MPCLKFSPRLFFVGLGWVVLLLVVIFLILPMVPMKWRMWWTCLQLTSLVIFNHILYTMEDYLKNCFFSCGLPDWIHWNNPLKFLPQQYTLVEFNRFTLFASCSQISWSHRVCHSPCHHPSPTLSITVLKILCFPV